MRSIFAFLMMLLFVATPAGAQEAPAIAPTPAWIEAAPIPAANPALKERPVQILLINTQSRYGKDGTRDHYLEYATLVQTPQGLSEMGNLALPWQPGASELIVHKVHIVRAGKVIDLLAQGQRFTALRRENNLEAATLDGTLTAVLQPEGLSVGDVLNVAWTLRLKPKAFAPAGENLLSLAPGVPIRNWRIRETWEDGVEMRWRGGGSLGKPRLRKSSGMNGLILDLEDAEGQPPPEGAPLRFSLPASLELSGYAGWPEISRLMAPLYAKAQAMVPGSPLQAEVDRIAAAAADPKVRALAALRLVQEKIRYFALAMGEGGYVPATADETWKRRFGDCKGKTVTLLALLAGLGIDAEPVLVSAGLGDSLGSRLPMIRPFDHVIVRARIGGRSYWLDGTRTDDRNMDALLSSPFGYGLPLSAGGSDLEKLPLEPPAAPLNDIRISYDASAGFDRLVPLTAEMILRGDLAATWRVLIAQKGEAAMSDSLKNSIPSIPNSDLELKSVRSDDATGDLHVRFTGLTHMRWYTPSGSKSPRFHIDDSVIQWPPKFERKPGPGSDAPFLLPFPVYLRLEQAIVLPRGGSGFTLDAKPLDETVAATRVIRTVRLEGGKAIAESTFRRLAPELSAPAAKAAAPALARLNENRAYVLAPAGYEISEAERAVLLVETPRDAEGFVARGYWLLSDSRVKAALADFDKAIELNPTYGRAHADRGVALVHLGRLDEAKTALYRARELEEDDFVVHQGLGMLYLALDKPAESVEAFNRSYQLEPEKTFTLRSRAAAYEQLGKLREALTDMQRVATLESDPSGALWEMASLHAALGEGEAALAANAKAAAQNPEEPFYSYHRGELLSRFGQKAEAMAAWAKALTLVERKLKAPDGDGVALLEQKIRLLMLRGEHKAAVAVTDARLRQYPGSVSYLTLRCVVRAEGAIELPQAVKDCDDAIRFDSGALDAFAARGMVKFRLGQWDAAISDYGAILAVEPKSCHALFGRGIARLRKGERETGERDLAAARRYCFDVDSEFAVAGLAP